MILADTSAWVEYDRATGSPVHRRVVDLITADGPLSVTEPVIMEVLAGARSEQREFDLRRLLLRFSLLRFDRLPEAAATSQPYPSSRCLQSLFRTAPGAVETYATFRPRTSPTGRAQNTTGITRRSGLTSPTASMMPRTFSSPAIGSSLIVRSKRFEINKR